MFIWIGFKIAAAYDDHTGCTAGSWIGHAPRRWESMHGTKDVWSGLVWSTGSMPAVPGYHDTEYWGV